MKKLWIRWIALIIGVAILGGIFIRLGEWQLHRLDQKRDRNASAVAHQKQPVKPWDQVFDGPIADDEQWQRVTVTGTFDAAKQLEVRYRNVGDQPGSEWVVPLRTKDGRWLLVNRGFTGKKEGTVIKPSAVPAGEVTVVGYARRSEIGKDNATVPVQGSVRLINAPAIAKAHGIDLPDGYVQHISSTPTVAEGMTAVGPPELDEGPHFSYAIQWFIFSAIAATGAILLIRADLRDRRRRRERAQKRILAAPGTDA